MINLFEHEHRSDKRIRTANDWMRVNFPEACQVHTFPFIEKFASDDSPLVEVMDLDDSCFASLLGPLGNPQYPTVHHQGQFLRYNPNKGIYEPLHVERIFAEWSLIIDRCASHFGERANVQSFQSLKRHQTLHRPLKRARELLQVDDEFFQDNDSRFIAVQNGIFDTRTRELLPFSPGYRFKSSLPVKFDPTSTPSNFLAFFRSVLDDDDLDLLQQYLGSCLLEKNYPQKILVLAGESGAGKGVVLRLMESILGSEKIGVLREQLFTDRFELARYAGKALLVNPDMPTDFLNTPKASILKQMVGGDLMSADRKGQPDPIQMHGDFGVILCCNALPRIKIDHDSDAWKRRLAIIELKEPKHGQRIGKLSEILGAVEKSAILNWLLEGREKVVRGGYQIHSSCLQEQRVMRLLSESSSHMQFVRECLEIDDASQITAEEVRKAYITFCRDRGLRPVDSFGFTKLIDGVIMSKLGVHHRHDIQDADGKARRGWKRIRLRSPPGSAAVSLSV